MQWDDILNDNKNDALNLNSVMNCNELLEFKQALISKKKDRLNTEYSVDREYVNSPEYQAKFEKIPVNKNVQMALHKQAGRLLEFVDGFEPEKQFQERLLAIDAKTGEFIVDNFDRDGNETRTGFNDEEYQKIEENPNRIILVHNHSGNGRPSSQDLLTCLHNDKVAMSVIACHNGDIYTVSDVKPAFETAYNELVTKYRLDGIHDAKNIAMTKMYEQNDKIKSHRHKLFTVNKL